MLKNFFLVCIAAVCFGSCGLDYDGETRNLYKGTVVDENALPLAGVPVEIIMHNNSFSEKVAFTYTDARGNFRLTAPKSKNGIPKVMINHPQRMDIDQFQENAWVTYHNINQETLSDYTLNLGTVALTSAGNTVRLTLNPVAEDIKKINITGLVSNNSVDLDFAVYAQPDTNNSAYNTYPYNAYYNDITTVFYVGKNQSLTVRYMDANGTLHEKPVTVAGEDLTVTLP
jgi:hypothetical protein